MAITVTRHVRLLCCELIRHGWVAGSPFFSDRQHLSCDGCLEVRGGIVFTIPYVIWYWTQEMVCKSGVLHAAQESQKCHYNAGRWCRRHIKCRTDSSSFCRLKVCRVICPHTAERLFHSGGPATAKLRWPIVVRVLGTCSKPVEADLRC